MGISVIDDPKEVVFDSTLKYNFNSLALTALTEITLGKLGKESSVMGGKSPQPSN